MMTERTIRYVPLREIEPEPRNPRTHDSLEDVKASILRFGFVEPIIQDERTGRLIAGHGRIEALTAMRQAGQAPPAGITLDDEDRWLVPVVHGWKSTDDDEATGILIALNRHAETGGWDETGLLKLLDELAESENGLAGIGYDDEARATLERLVAATGKVLDAAGEWADAGMPDYDSPGAESAYKTTVHFASEDDADAFFHLLARSRATYFWWPQDGEQRMTSREQIVTDDG